MAPADNDDPAYGPPPPITEADNVKYVGKYILIGITNEDAFGNVVNKQQMHGVIERITPSAIEVRTKRDVSFEWMNAAARRPAAA